MRTLKDLRSSDITPGTMIFWTGDDDSDNMGLDLIIACQQRGSSTMNLPRQIFATLCVTKRPGAQHKCNANKQRFDSDFIDLFPNEGDNIEFAIHGGKIWACVTRVILPSGEEVIK